MRLPWAWGLGFVGSAPIGKSLRQTWGLSGAQSRDTCMRVWAQNASFLCVCCPLLPGPLPGTLWPCATAWTSEIMACQMMEEAGADGSGRVSPLPPLISPRLLLQGCGLA